MVLLTFIIANYDEPPALLLTFIIEIYDEPPAFARPGENFRKILVLPTTEVTADGLP